jgi:hypothetical protein
VRKPVLGRGLGRLMQTPSASQPTEEPSPIAPGLRILIRGTEAVPPPTVTTDAAAPAQPSERSPVAAAEANAGSAQTADASPALAQEAADARVTWMPVAGIALLLADIALVIWAVTWLHLQANPSGIGITGCVLSGVVACLSGMLGARLLFK